MRLETVRKDTVDDERAMFGCVGRWFLDGNSSETGKLGSKRATYEPNIQRRERPLGSRASGRGAGGQQQKPIRGNGNDSRGAVKAVGGAGRGGGGKGEEEEEEEGWC